MKFNQRLLFACSAMVFLFLSGCGPTAPSNTLSVDLVSPRTSIVIWPQSPYILAAQAFLQGSGSNPSGDQAAHVTFYANGQMIGAVDSSTNRQAVLKWTPPTVGEYSIQAQAQVNGNTASSKFVQMCILNIDTSQGFRLWGYGYNGSCALPPASTSTTPVKLSASAKPAGLSYSYSCPTSISATILNFQVNVTDPGNRVAFVAIKYMGQNYASKSPLVFDGASSNDLYDSVMLNETSLASDGTKIFTGSTEDLGPISSEILSGATGGIQWWARALKSNGVGADQVLAEIGPQTVPIGPCTPPAGTPGP
ncbi:MAG TPA: hypothetical protein VLX61_15650 [Anaerolineales bacterium]|nr:hypothetical protein [Anaerolineales bacterium]